MDSAHCVHLDNAQDLCNSRPMFLLSSFDWPPPPCTRSFWSSATRARNLTISSLGSTSITGLCNTLLGALSRLFRRFCTEGLQIAQPIGQLLLHLNLGFPGFSDVLLYSGYLSFHSCDILEAQIEALPNWTHLSLTLRPFQCNLQRFGIGVVLGPKVSTPPRVSPHVRTLLPLFAVGALALEPPPSLSSKPPPEQIWHWTAPAPKLAMLLSKRPTFCGARSAATGFPPPLALALREREAIGLKAGVVPLMTSYQPLGVAMELHPLRGMNCVRLTRATKERTLQRSLLSCVNKESLSLEPKWPEFDVFPINSLVFLR